MASVKELLDRLDERLIMGEISERLYYQLKKKLETKLDSSSKGNSSIRFDSSNPSATSLNSSNIFMSVQTDSSQTVGAIQLPINVGDVFDNGRYKVLSFLGAGAFGAVYRAYDFTLKNEIAVKIVAVSPEEGKSERALELLLHEYNLRNRMNDVSCIMKSDDPRPCNFKGLSLVLLPMELSDEGSLRSWLNDNESDEKRQGKGIELFKDICNGVKAIHEVDMVHMDLKPENFLLVNGHAKITDFGIGRMIGDSFEMNPDQLIKQGIGTLQYMSPEQFRAARQKDIDSTSDIYSLGLILYEILDGSLPFDGCLEELKEKHLNLPPPPLKGSSGKWWKLIERCLKKSPGDRYSTVEGLLMDVERVQQGAALSVEVACPRCGHINCNPNHKSCDSCRTDISKFFCSCPRCSREVRKDVEICPDCGEKVLAFYLLQNRWRKIGQIKNSNPVEAIFLLSLILREGAGQYDREARTTIKEVRSKLSLMQGIIRDAENAMTEGKVRNALENWKKILALFPLHAVALRKIRELDSLLTKCSSLLLKGKRLIDEAAFNEAQKVLQENLQLMPGTKDVELLLKSCIRNSVKYEASVKKATFYKEKKFLVKSLIQVEIALNLAIHSKKTKKLKKSLEVEMAKSSNLFVSAQRNLEEANFIESDICLATIKKKQRDFNGIVEFEENLVLTRNKYFIIVNELKTNMKAKHLVKCLKLAKKALVLCPSSAEAKRYITDFEAKIRETNINFEKVVLLIDSAQFDKANQLLNSIKGTNIDIVGITEIVFSLNNRKEKYFKEIDRANLQYSSKNLGNLLSILKLALEICPNSQTANRFFYEVKSEKMRTNELLRKGEKYLEQAQFSKSEECVVLAESLWITLPAVGTLRTKLKNIKKSYTKLISNSKLALSKKDFDAASASCQSAIIYCPNSQEVKGLQLRIKESLHANTLEKRRIEEVKLARVVELRRRAAEKRARTTGGTGTRKIGESESI